MTWHASQQESLGTQLLIEYEHTSDVSEFVWEIAEKLERRFSRFRSDSELTQFNQVLNTWHVIDDEWFYLLSLARDLENRTAGALNITVHDLLDAWGYDADYSLQEKSTAGFIGHFEVEPGRFRSTRPIDLGSIGKGYFLDLVRGYFLEQGVQNFFINAGGDVYAHGKDPDSHPWKTYLVDPRNENLVIGEMEISEMFACASSPQHRRWRDRHHLVDTEREAPANDMQVVYVQSIDSGARTDGISTAAFSMGFDRAKSFLTNEKLSALLIGPGGAVWCSPNFCGKLYTT